jgi:putative phosphoesterase
MTTANVPASVRRVAALYDVHGNVAALDAVLAEALALEPDVLIIGGDALPGPFPRDVLDRLRALEVPAICLRGNGERELLAATPTEEPLLAQLNGDARATVAGWQAAVTLELPGLGRTVFCHAAPADDEQIVTPATPDEVLRDVYGGLGAALVVLGHTHIQFDRRVGDLRIVNPGSVGSPYADQPGAYWALLDDGRAYLRRTTYDLTAAAADIAMRSSWPMATAFAAENVTRVPSAEEATAVFEAQRKERAAR